MGETLFAAPNAELVYGMSHDLKERGMSEPIHSGIGKILVEVMDEQRDALATARAEVNAVRRTLAAQRTALLALAERIRREGMQGVANEIEEIVRG